VSEIVECFAAFRYSRGWSWDALAALDDMQFSGVLDWTLDPGPWTLDAQADDVDACASIAELALASLALASRPDSEIEIALQTFPKAFSDTLIAIDLERSRREFSGACRARYPKR
jgi:hypothetical protein